MKLINVLKTKSYQVFDVGYGAIILNERNETDELRYYSVLMQGDEANLFLKDLEKMEEANLSESKLEYVLSQYQDVMNPISKEELHNLGIYSKEELSLKAKL